MTTTVKEEAGVVVGEKRAEEKDVKLGDTPATTTTANMEDNTKEGRNEEDTGMSGTATTPSPDVQNTTKTEEPKSTQPPTTQEPALSRPPSTVISPPSPLPAPTTAAPPPPTETSADHRHSVLSATSLQTFATAHQDSNRNSLSPPSIIEPPLIGPTRTRSTRSPTSVISAYQRSSIVGTASLSGASGTVTLSPEDELLSLKVRSLYDSAGPGSDVVSTSSRRKRLSRVGRNSMAVSESAAEGILAEAKKEEEAEAEAEKAISESEEEEEPAQERDIIEDWENLNGEEVDRYGFIVPSNPNSPSKNGRQAVSFDNSATQPSPGRRKIRRKELSIITSSLHLEKPNDMLQSPMVWERENQKVKELKRARKWTNMAKAATLAAKSAREKVDAEREKEREKEEREREKAERRANRSAKHKFAASLRLKRGRHAAAGIQKIDEEVAATAAIAGAPQIQTSDHDSGAIPSSTTSAKPASSIAETVDSTPAFLEWEFDTTDAKLISRTWKGIPDCWRSAAWHSFLTTSARKSPYSLSDAALIKAYHHLVNQPSADDVQIDLDVPRTISSHIMFRRRYKGGQRLLFRVLHALSLHFPEIGYVQGMASPAATILCYYAEEWAFVMLVRMWEVRGLARLFAPGFSGLMDALEELETKWLRGNGVAKRLERLGVSPTIYATKWYLTLFNYSIPFPAQLRVWDVFMLLDPENVGPVAIQAGGGIPGSLSTSILAPSTISVASTHSSHPHNANLPNTSADPPPFPLPPLTILHATSSALLDSLRPVLLKADFETAMTTLTSYIPVKDEDVLMRVVKEKWRGGRKRERWAKRAGRLKGLNMNMKGEGGRSVVSLGLGRPGTRDEK